MSLHPPFRTRLQSRLYRRRYLGTLLLFAAAIGIAICVIDPPNSHDRTAAIVICGTLAGFGALAFIRGRELPTTDVMRFAQSRGGLVTLSEIATTLDLDPETVVKTLRKLQKLGVAMHRWEEVRRNLWEFPDYLPMVAEPQPTRIRSSRTPSTIGGCEACTTTLAPPSISSSAALPLHRLRRVSHVTVPSWRLPPVR